MNGWGLRWACTGDQKVRSFWSAKVTQSGAAVTARTESWNAKIPAGGSVTLGLIGSTVGGANPAPNLVTLNGTACAVS